MPVIKMADVNLQGKRVLVREDFNVPLQNARVKSDIRLKAAIPTLQAILDQGAAQIMVASHMGRPKEGMFDPAFSLQPVAQRLSELLHHPVELYSDWVTHPERLPQASDHIIMLENVRFNQGELENDTKLAQQIASLCDVFVYGCVCCGASCSCLYVWCC